MKTQQELNNDYDKVMIDFKQKAFIEYSFKFNRNLNDSNSQSKNSFIPPGPTYRYDEYNITEACSKFSNHFNEEYKHIYLKPLLSLNKDPKKNNNQSFLNALENLPSTFFNTAMGEEFVISHAHAFSINLFLLPITEERELILLKKKHLEDPYRDTFQNLAKNEKIHIQENLSDFVDIFLHSDKYPESIKTKCCHILFNEIEIFLNAKNDSYSHPFKLDNFKHTDFLIDVFESIEFKNPFTELNDNFFRIKLNSSRKPFSI